MILITSAAYISPGLISEFGKLPPAMLPVKNKRLYEHQLALFPNEHIKVLSLPVSYTLTEYDAKRLDELTVKVIHVPDNLTLGESVVYVLNVLSQYSEHLKILHGDTLFSKLPEERDGYTVSTSDIDYAWSKTDNDLEVMTGFFAFSNQSLLIRKITEKGYRFIDGVRAYGEDLSLKKIQSSDWLDFGLVNSYYRSISKMTTERAFNNLLVDRYSLTKSSKEVRKILAEANWLKSLPNEMKHYAPAIWESGEKDGVGYYTIEYYYLSSLANLFVFGKNPDFVWKDIINACIEYINDEAKYIPEHAEEIAIGNDDLYAPKTKLRLDKYAAQTGLDLSHEWVLNGIKVPSLKQIIEETNALITKKEIKFVCLMHGDFCFSNILYDFKSMSIRVIDPRGIDSKGNNSIYGDLRYDVAKLAHSVLGMYDFIIGGMFHYEQKEEYDITFGFEKNDLLASIQAYFNTQSFAGYTLEQLSTYPILIHLFLSMLPLHNDNPARQKAFLANALRLYIQFKNL